MVVNKHTSAVCCLHSEQANEISNFHMALHTPNTEAHVIMHVRRERLRSESKSTLSKLTEITVLFSITARK